MHTSGVCILSTTLVVLRARSILFNVHSRVCIIFILIARVCIVTTSYVSLDTPGNPSMHDWDRMGRDGGWGLGLGLGDYEDKIPPWNLF